MPTIKDIAMDEHFEAMCMAFKKDGAGWVITLRVQNDDLFHDGGGAFEVLKEPLGAARYMIAMVKIGEDEQPVAPKPLLQGEQAVATAGRLCRNKEFQVFLLDYGWAEELGETAAIKALYENLNISSRSELKDNREARETFYNAIKTFEENYQR
tara:strand:+ start:2612 stop:3073 length:462 start_codon:yes stop_codon:yes gene_type:complete